MKRKTDRTPGSKPEINQERSPSGERSQDRWVMQEPTVGPYADAGTPAPTQASHEPALATEEEVLAVANDIITRYRPALERLVHR